MSTAPKRITYHKEAAELELGWADGTNHRLSAEFLRVHSPSAEVRGHGVGQEVLQIGKRYVTITGIEPTGRYAIKITSVDVPGGPLGTPERVASYPISHRISNSEHGSPITFVIVPPMH